MLLECRLDIKEKHPKGHLRSSGKATKSAQQMGRKTGLLAMEASHLSWHFHVRCPANEHFGARARGIFYHMWSKA